MRNNAQIDDGQHLPVSHVYRGHQAFNGLSDSHRPFVADIETRRIQDATAAELLRKGAEIRGGISMPAASRPVRLISFTLLAIVNQLLNLRAQSKQ